MRDDQPLDEEAIKFIVHESLSKKEICKKVQIIIGQSFNNFHNQQNMLNAIENKFLEFCCSVSAH